MLNQRIEIRYQFTFETPFHLGTGLRNGLVHRSIITAPDGYLIIPGSTIKGSLRDRCSQISRLFNFPEDDPHVNNVSKANPQSTLIELVFGSQFQPGRLYFDDAKLIKADQDLFEPDYKDFRMSNRKRDKFRSWQTEKRTQVSIWRPTHTAAAGRLYNSEYGIRGLRFEGQIVGLLSGYATLSDSPHNYSLIFLIMGLGSLEWLGGNKSSGAGLLNCEILRLAVDGQILDPASMLMNLQDMDYALYDLVVAQERGS
ncbi:MAG: hypothetical protein KGS73_06100 [Chloroflexi bacterium]|nr:hypothetical protein [Chloroflexota bacterium]